jgi:hypothetical protein
MQMPMQQSKIVCGIGSTNVGVVLVFLDTPNFKLMQQSATQYYLSLLLSLSLSLSSILSSSSLLAATLNQPSISLLAFNNSHHPISSIMKS